MEEQEEGEFRDVSAGKHRYEKKPHKGLFRLGGWGGGGGSLDTIDLKPLRLVTTSGSLDTIDLEPLRVVTTNGSEWGLENFGEMVEAKVGPDEDRQWTEEVQSISSEGSVYENWEDSCLVIFCRFLGFLLRALRMRSWA